MASRGYDLDRKLGARGFAAAPNRTATPRIVRGMHIEAAHKAATAAGLITAPIGIALLAAPRLTGFVGWKKTQTRAVGAVDLALSLGLLVARPRWPWVAVRSAANVVTAGLLVREGTSNGRAAAGLLAGLTVVDAAAARSLQVSGA